MSHVSIANVSGEDLHLTQYIPSNLWKDWKNQPWGRCLLYS